MVECVGASCAVDSSEFEMRLERELVRVCELVCELVCEWLWLEGKDFEGKDRRAFSGFSGFENSSSSVVSEEVQFHKN